MRLALAALACLLALPAWPADFQKPTETELRSAYCIAVLERDNAVFREYAGGPRLRPGDTPENVDDARDRIVERESALNRLQAFLNPRLTSLNLDPRSIAVAQAQAKDDYRRLTESGQACMPRCQNTRDARACLASCMDKGIQSKFDACRSPRWLPD